MQANPKRPRKGSSMKVGDKAYSDDLDPREGDKTTGSEALTNGVAS